MLKIGSKQIVDAYVGTERIGKMYAGDLVFEAPLPGRLPKGYKEVEYVKWTDTSTRFALLETVNSGTDKIIYKFKPSAYGSANNVYSYLLLNNGTTTRSSCITFNSSAENKFNYAIYYTSTKSITMQTKDALLEFMIDFYNGDYNVNGISLTGYRSTTNVLVGTGAKNIGGGKWINISYSSCPGAFYSLIQYRNNNLIREYVPCINPNGVAGIYEIVSETFINPTKVVVPGPTV